MTHTKATHTGGGQGLAPAYLGVGEQQSCDLVRHHGRVPRDVPGQDRNFQVHRLQDRRRTQVGGAAGAARADEPVPGQLLLFTGPLAAPGEDSLTK